MHASESLATLTNSQSGLTKKLIYVSSPLTAITSSTITMGWRWGISSSIEGKGPRLSNVGLFCSDGTHFSAGDHPAVKGYLALHNSHTEHPLQDRNARAELIACPGQMEDLKIPDGPYITYRGRQVPFKMIIPLVQGNGLGKMLHDTRLTEHSQPVYQHMLLRHGKAGNNRVRFMLKQPVYQHKGRLLGY